jgi:hypothetical protein
MPAVLSTPPGRCEALGAKKTASYFQANVDNALRLKKKWNPKAKVYLSVWWHYMCSQHVTQDLGYFVSDGNIVGLFGATGHDGIALWGSVGASTGEDQNATEVVQYLDRVWAPHVVQHCQPAAPLQHGPQRKQRCTGHRCETTEDDRGQIALPGSGWKTDDDGGATAYVLGAANIVDQAAVGVPCSEAVGLKLAREFCRNPTLSCSCPGCALSDWLALQSGPGAPQWRCYSPTALNANRTAWQAGPDYCSENAKILGVLKTCKLPPAPPPAAPIPGVPVFGQGMVVAADSHLPHPLAPAPRADQDAACVRRGAKILGLRLRPQGPCHAPQYRSRSEFSTGGEIIFLQVALFHFKFNPRKIETYGFV